MIIYVIDPKPAEILKWTCPPSVFGTVYYLFLELI